MKNYFSTNLRFIREKRGLSKSDLAKKMNVNQSTISRWENEQMGITVENAYDLSQILNISLPELLGKDLRVSSEYENVFDTDSDNLQALNKVLKNKGIINENDEISAEDFDRLMDFTEKNLEYIRKDEQKKK